MEKITVQDIIDCRCMYLHAGINAAVWCHTQIIDAYGSGADDHDFILESIRRKAAFNYVGNRVVRECPSRPQIIN